MSELLGRSTSQILVESGKDIKIILDKVHVADLKEQMETRKGSIGNRELFIYAKVMRDGYFYKYEKITDLAEHMTAFNDVVVQNKNLFTDSINNNYHLIIKVWEVDTKNLVRLLRRIHKTDAQAMDTFYAPGSTFISGLTEVIDGIFNMVLSVTGKSLDDWAMQLGGTKIFEHSVYINHCAGDQPNVTFTENKDKFLIVQDPDLIKDTSPITVTKDTSPITVTKEKDKEMYIYETNVLPVIRKIEGKNLTNYDTVLSKSNYIVFSFYKLELAPENKKKPVRNSDSKAD